MRKIITYEGRNYAVESDQALIDRTNLGKRPQVCKLCGAKGDFQTWECFELADGTYDKFNYFECPQCFILQIEQIPDNIDKYYAEGYYSFIPPEIKPPPEGAPALTPRVLDVGCGNGAWLCEMAEKGYINLTGIDPFIKEDIEYPNGVKIKKGYIHDLKGKFDYIRLHQSFEHMPDPSDVFASLKRLLSHGQGIDGGPAEILISIPIFPFMAFDLFGPYCYQIDPPRHYFLHSIKSIDMLAVKHGLRISNILFNYSMNQFLLPAYIQQGFTSIQISNQLDKFLRLAELKGETKVFTELAMVAAKNGTTDIAVFTLTHA